MRTTENAGAEVASDGHHLQAHPVAIRERAPSTHQVIVGPVETKAGTRVPERTIPDPTPEKMRPAASPRLFSGTKGRMVGAASTLSEPPARPDPKRHTKNQTKQIGVAPAHTAPDARSIISRTAHLDCPRLENR